MCARDLSASLAEASVHYVVTEHGIADLWGKNIRERAKALIEIAHPDFRAELLAAAKQRRYVLPDQIAPSRAIPWRETSSHELRSGERVVVRPARICDEQPLQDLFYRLSDQSTYLRFLGYKRRTRTKRCSSWWISITSTIWRSWRAPAPTIAGVNGPGFEAALDLRAVEHGAATRETIYRASMARF